MTTITLPRATVEQALEALEEACEIIGAAWAWRDEKGKPTITALSTALAQQAEPVQEQDVELSAALGWPGGISNPVLDRKVLLQKVAALAQQAEPLPKHDQHCVDVPGYGLMAVRLVRAVERAHGIGGNNG